MLLCNVYDLPCSILYQVHSPPHPISTPPLLPFILFHLFSFLLPFSSLTFYHETSSLNPPPTFPPLSSSPFISFPFAFPLPFPFLFFFCLFQANEVRIRAETDALKSRRHSVVAAIALWFRTAMNRDVSTGPLAFPSARSLVPLKHSLALPCSLRSLAPLRSFVPSLAYSLTPELMVEWIIRCFNIRLF